MAGAGAGAARSEGSTCSASSEQSMLAQGDETLRAAESRMTGILQHFVSDVEARISASLKDAAGEVASHLGKEAAARLVAAERKVAFLEAELVSAKDQALAMLLRLKQHTDSQIYDLEQLLIAERKRADDAEAKLSDSGKRAKKKGGGGGGGGESTSGRGSGKQSHSEEPTIDQQDDVSDSLALIAGVACDVMQQPRETDSPDRDKNTDIDNNNNNNNNNNTDNNNDDDNNNDNNNNNECSSQSEKMRNDSDEVEDGDEPESPTPRAAAAAAAAAVATSTINTRYRKRKSIMEEQQQHQQQQQRPQRRRRPQREPSADELDMSEPEDDDEDDDDVSIENGVSSERKRPAPRQLRKSTRKSRTVSTSEKLTRLMSGSKRARAKGSRAADSKKPSASSVPESSSRDSRRLMQGARQLFSLAEKKW